MHPSLGFGDGDPVRVVTRRGAVSYPALVTETIRPDTVFVPYHWAGPVAANVLTIDALDPISRMPEFKVCACRVERAEEVDPVPEPPVPPGQRPYRPETAPLTERRPPTMPQGRGTAWARCGCCSPSRRCRSGWRWPSGWQNHATAEEDRHPPGRPR